MEISWGYLAKPTSRQDSDFDGPTFLGQLEVDLAASSILDEFVFLQIVLRCVWRVAEVFLNCDCEKLSAFRRLLRVAAIVRTPSTCQWTFLFRRQDGEHNGEDQRVGVAVLFECSWAD
jgi:hypothetical protein